MAHSPNSLVIRTRVDYKTEVRQELFLNALKKLLNVSVALEVTGISRFLAYQWKKENKEFSDKWDQAIDLAEGSLESAVYLKLAQALSDGRRKISMPEAKLIEMFLSGFFPDKYRQRYDIDNRTLNITLDWSNVPDELLEQFNSGKITLEDVYQKITIQQATGSDRTAESTEGSGET